MTRPGVRLTNPQRRHMSELHAIEQEKGAAFWTPIGSAEERCARALPLPGSADGGLGLTEDEITSQAYELKTQNEDERIVNVETITKLGRAVARVWIAKQ